MAGNIPFQAITSTYVFSAAGTAGTALQIAATGGNTTYEQYLVANAGAAGAWVTLSFTQAGATQVIPVVGTPGNAVWIEAGNTRVLSGPSQAWFNAQTATGTTTIYVTGGDGILTGVSSVGEGGSGPVTTVAISQATPGVSNGVQDIADGPVAAGTAATKSQLAGLVFNSTPPVLTSGQQAALQGDANANLLVLPNAQRPTYVAYGIAYGGYATPTDMLTLSQPASPTKLIRVVNMGMYINSTAGALQTIYYIRRSTANTGGASTNPAATSLDSADAAATGIVTLYTAAPTLGTPAGNLVILPNVSTVPTAAGALNNITAGAVTAANSTSILQNVVLRAANETLAFNYNGAALTVGFSAIWFVIWTEV